MSFDKIFDLKPGVYFYFYNIYIYIFFFFAHIHFPASGQTVVTGVVPSPPRFLPSIFITHGVQRSHCSSIFHRVLLTHALALSPSQIVRKKNVAPWARLIRCNFFLYVRKRASICQDEVVENRRPIHTTSVKQKHAGCLYIAEF